MDRPDLKSILAPLKPFQRRTVEHGFRRLFTANGSTARFLVADEVGLGKTLVARGIIAKTIDHLWDDVGRIDIVYICSNQSIARANLPKLRVGGEAERSFALATRLTLLATEMAPQSGRARLADSKVNFISFTPGTSFQMGHSGGQAKERRVLFALLESMFPSRRRGLMNLLQGGVTRTQWWRDTLTHQPLPLDPGIRRAFRTAVRQSPDLRNEIRALIDTWFHRSRKEWPRDVRMQRNRLLGELRRLLAGICIDALEPDLIILDEFQRFKSLLEHRPELQDPAAEIAQALFAAQTPEGHPVRTLLLSATPYKLYTADAEIAHEDHYKDFLATLRFLMSNREDRVTKLKRQLADFGAALKRAAAGEPAAVLEQKTVVERTLRKYMARTERVAASEAQDAMVEEPKVQVEFRADDVRQYLAADALFRAVGSYDPIDLWKSAPYLANFMLGYKFNTSFDEALIREPETVARVLRSHPEAFLQASSIHGWAAIDPANAKLRELVSDLLDGGLWRLLWIPPTLPYWPLAGAFEGQDRWTKSLVFSAWNVVPDVVSAVVSYEAERRMVGGQMESYADPDRQQSMLLRLTQTRDTRSRHRLLLLLLPCAALADLAHPLRAPPDTDRRSWVRRRIDELLADPRLPDPQDGPVDDRWEWVAPLLLDPAMRPFLESWRDAAVEDMDKPNPEIFPGYVDDLLALDPNELGRRPEGLGDLLTELALGAPAVLAMRTLAPAGLPDTSRRQLATRLAMAFWKLFNRPAVIKLINQLHAEGSFEGQEDAPYWRHVIQYCIDGNLQAVLDESWHLAWEQHAWAENEPPEAIAGRCIEELAGSVEPRPSRVHARFYEVRSASEVYPDEIRLRTVVALRFGHASSDEGIISQDAVRAAFNSPFRPFVLASTSVGQEGLDFHPWCHRLVHWNLPGNPVDLEQREGRVHRYKGHAVRRNVAQSHGPAAITAWRPGDCLWNRVFELANTEARARGASDLVPYWIADGDFKVQRRVPLLPYTREVEGFKRLKRQLAAYRVVFGQPRQEELVTLLERADIDTAELRRWAIDLTP
ncbi:MAG: helicase-related protein [Gammaproteobacteria bacterium]